MPTTPDEFFEVMTAFKTGDPNGNGVADEIPITGSAQWSLVPYIMNAFIANSFNTGAGANSQPISLGLDGDTVQMQTMQDGWREGLKFLNKLWAAGLIDPAAFSQGGDTMQATGNSAEGVIVGGFTAIHPWIGVSIGQEDGRDNQYNPLPPLEGAEGPITTYQLPSVPGATFVVTKAADEVEQQVIMEMMDYIFSPEGHLLGEMGEEDIGWRAPEEGEIALDQELEPCFVDLPLDEENEADYNGNWGPMAQVFDTVEWRNCQVQPLDIYTEEGAERRLFEATELYEGKESDANFPYWNLLGAGRRGERTLDPHDQHREQRGHGDGGVHHRGARSQQRRRLGCLPAGPPGPRCGPLCRNLAGGVRRQLTDDIDRARRMPRPRSRRRTGHERNTAMETADDQVAPGRARVGPRPGRRRSAEGAATRRGRRRQHRRAFGGDSHRGGSPRRRGLGHVVVRAADGERSRAPSPHGGSPHLDRR